MTYEQAAIVRHLGEAMTYIDAARTSLNLALQITPRSTSLEVKLKNALRLLYCDKCPDLDFGNGLAFQLLSGIDLDIK